MAANQPPRWPFWSETVDEAKPRKRQRSEGSESPPPVERQPMNLQPAQQQMSGQGQPGISGPTSALSSMPIEPMETAPTNTEAGQSLPPPNMWAIIKALYEEKGMSPDGCPPSPPGLTPQSPSPEVVSGQVSSPAPVVESTHMAAPAPRLLVESPSSSPYLGPPRDTPSPPLWKDSPSPPASIQRSPSPSVISKHGSSPVLMQIDSSSPILQQRAASPSPPPVSRKRKDSRSLSVSTHRKPLASSAKNPENSRSASTPMQFLPAQESWFPSTLQKNPAPSPPGLKKRSPSPPVYIEIASSSPPPVPKPPVSRPSSKKKSARLTEASSAMTFLAPKQALFSASVKTHSVAKQALQAPKQSLFLPSKQTQSLAKTVTTAERTKSTDFTRDVRRKSAGFGRDFKIPQPHEPADFSRDVHRKSAGFGRDFKIPQPHEPTDSASDSDAPMLARRDHKLQRLSRTSPRPGRRQSQQKSPLSDDAPPLSNDVPKKVDYSLIKAKKRPSNLPPVEIPKRPDAAEDQGSRYAKVKRVRVSSGADYTSEQRFNRSASPEDIRLTRSEKYALDDIGLAATAVLNAPSPTPALIAALRKAVQEAPFTKVSLSTRSKVTDPFLALLSSRRLRLPVDITLDALSLITRWSAGDLSPDLLRGITKTTRTKPLPGHAHRTTTSSALAKPYPFRRDPSTPGANGLTIGAWWPLQLCALRDGAHGSTEAGIAGAAATGAVSIILAGGYDDVDELTTVRYCGTRGAPASDGGDTGDASHGTRLLLQALRTGGAVRVLRSAKARAKSRYAPVCGYRYDGLYRVVEREWLDRKTAMMRFRMVRVPGQPEVRWRGEGERPTRVEVRAWEGAREAWRHVD